MAVLRKVAFIVFKSRSEKCSSHRFWKCPSVLLVIFVGLLGPSEIGVIFGVEDFSAHQCALMVLREICDFC